MNDHSVLHELIRFVAVAFFLIGCSPGEPSATDTTAVQEAVETPTALPKTATSASYALGDTWTRPADGMVMVYVPAGEFRMGSSAEDVEYAMQLCAQYRGPDYPCSMDRGELELERPEHWVVLDGFWIDGTEVSNGRFLQCVAAGECEPPYETSSLTRDSYFGEAAFDNYPVIWVDWHQANAYCMWAGARLPTEAEWEYAARGPDKRLFPWGDELDGTRLNYCDVNCPQDGKDSDADDGHADTAPVGSYPEGASWCGAYDLSGNVYEWVDGWYRLYPAAREQNPSGPESGESRILRGGAFPNLWDSLRSSYRGDVPSIHRSYHIGFRCALSPDE